MDEPTLHKKINEVIRANDKTICLIGPALPSGLITVMLDSRTYVNTIVIPFGNKWEKTALLRKIL